MLPPVAEIHFVAANMNVRAGKETHHLGEHALYEVHRLWTRRAKDPAYITGHAHAPRDIRADGAIAICSVAGELRIRSQRRCGMARHLDFGNYCDVTLLGVSDDFADLRLSVI